jgi:hypothetical protein
MISRNNIFKSRAFGTFLFFWRFGVRCVWSDRLELNEAVKDEQKGNKERWACQFK